MIYALVTLYNPKDTVVKNMRSLSSQVDKIYLLDNSGLSNAHTFSEIANAEYVFFNANLGLSEAFNRILKTYKFEDDDFIIFFDQDSHIESGHIQTLVAEYNALKEKNSPIGCLGPAYYNTSSGQIEIPKQKIKLSEHLYEVKSLITSSMLVQFKMLKEIDYWNEDVFLDMADWDLCWRIIASGKICCMTDSVILQHTLGQGEKRILKLRIKIDSPIRAYYQIRDSLYLMNKKYVPLNFRIYFFILLTIRPLLHFLLLNYKTKRFYYYFRGIYDYCTNKRGEFKNDYF